MMKNEDELMKWCFDLIRTYQVNRQYGSITFKFEAGRITNAISETSLKPLIDIDFNK